MANTFVCHCTQIQSSYRIYKFDAISFISKYFYFFRLNHSIYTRADIVKKTMMTLLKSNYMPEKMR